MARYQRLSAQDRSFLDLEEPNTPMHVGGVFIFEGAPLLREGGGVDIDAIRAYIASRLHDIPRYRQRLDSIPIENHPVWVDDERFNIAYHVRHTSLPHPGDEAQLKRLCGRILSQQLDRGKPLWEFWVVEGLEHERVALVSKVHHCMVDGVSGIDLLQVLLSLAPTKKIPTAPAFVPAPRPSAVVLLADALWRRGAQPWQAVRALRRAARDPAAAAEDLFEAAEGLVASLRAGLNRGSDTPLNGTLGPHRRFDWIAFDLDDVKAVKNALGGTVNDVVLATVAGAVGRFFEQRGVTRAEQRKMDFRAFCPVSVRSQGERGSLGNRVAAMIASLPISVADARGRLAAVRETMGDLKASKQALGAEVLSSVSEWTAPMLVALAARLAFRNRSSNMVVTNVPGPQVPLYLLGAKMTETYPMVPLFEVQGLGIALFSYAGGLYWGLNADWDMLPDLQEFVRALDASFRELCEAADPEDG